MNILARLRRPLPPAGPITMRDGPGYEAQNRRAAELRKLVDQTELPAYVREYISLILDRNGDLAFAFNRLALANEDHLRGLRGILSDDHLMERMVDRAYCNQDIRASRRAMVEDILEIALTQG